MPGADPLSRVLRGMAPAAGAYMAAIGRAQATMRAFECLIVVRRWELARGGKAADLDSAAREAGLKAVPLDPFDGSPMRLRFAGTLPVVYSVRPDGVDDHGQGARESESHGRSIKGLNCPRPLTRREFRSAALPPRASRNDARKRSKRAWSPACAAKRPYAPAAVGRAQATMRAFECLIVVRRWELARGGKAADLDSAAREAGLKAVPLDPFDGSPMRLRFAGTLPVVYSVGPDGVDDHGLEDSRSDRQTGDIVLFMPRSP